MNPIVSEFIKLLAREIASEVAKQIVKPAKAKKAEPAPAAPQETFKPDIVADRSDEEWRADCLTIINTLAPTHGRELRALLGKFDGAKRLSEIAAGSLPALLAELAALQDAK